MTTAALDDGRGGAPASNADAPVDSADDLRSLVTVTRTHDGDVRQRQVMARIDSRPATTLYFGDSFTQDVSPGTHYLRAHNTLMWKKVEFQVEPGEHIEFIVINRAGSLTLGFLALLGVAPLYLSIERRSVV